MKNLDEVGFFADAIVDQDRRMDELADSGSSVHGTADIWEALEEIDVVQDGGTESFGRGRKISPGIGQNFL